jgi:hypothetical protein
MAAVGMVQNAESNQMNRIFDNVEFWRVCGHEVEAYRDSERFGCFKNGGLHFGSVRCVAVKEDVYRLFATLVVVTNEVGEERGDLFGLCLFRGLEVMLALNEVDGEEAVGAVSFFSSVFTTGRVFFSAQP